MADELISSLQNDLKVSSTAQGEKSKKLLISSYLQPDPLLLSPLSFQTNHTTPSQHARAPVGRPLTQHGLNDYHYSKYHRRSQPPPPSDTASVCSTDSGFSLHSAFTERTEPAVPVPRRRSLPPNTYSPSRASSRRSEAPSLWSVLHEDSTIQDDSFHDAASLSSTHDQSLFQDAIHEPMDISPDRPVKSHTAQRPTPCSHESTTHPLKLRRQGTGSGSRLNLEGIRKINTGVVGDNTQVHADFNRKASTAEDISGSTPESQEGKVGETKRGRSCCGKIAIMLLQIAVGTGIVIASMLGVDVFGFYCLHSRTLNVTTLTQSLSNNVYGQHIVVHVLPILLANYAGETEIHRQPPLVLSFHGWTGIGKNHVSFLLGKELRSGQAHKIISTLHFPHNDVDYEKELEDMIFPRLYKCRLNLFIIDEIDKAPMSVVKSLVRILKHVRTEEFMREDYRIIFLLLSNTGASHINRYVYDALRNRQILREDITREDLVDVLLSAQHKDTEGFQLFSELHENGLIDHVIPFLPLERRHVEKCATADMQTKGMVPTQGMVQTVLKEMSFFPAEYPIFSSSGCRKVPTKVDVTGL